MIIEIYCIVSKCRTRAPCNLGVKDCPAPAAAPFKIIDAAVWGVKGLCEVVAGVDYKGGTCVHALSCFFQDCSSVSQRITNSFYIDFCCFLLGDLDSFSIPLGRLNVPNYTECCR